MIEQIRMALRLYKERGEFDGSTKSARECLEEAEYEWTPELASIVAQLQNETKLPK
jgi:hypothetical protein